MNVVKKVASNKETVHVGLRVRSSLAQEDRSAGEHGLADEHNKIASKHSTSLFGKFVGDRTRESSKLFEMKYKMEMGRVFL
jgi:hypothetical protein